MIPPLSTVKCRVLLLSGGWSNERAVSLASQESLYQALEHAGYAVQVIDPCHLPQKCAGQITQSFQGAGPQVIFNGLYGGEGENGYIAHLASLLSLPCTHSSASTSALAMRKDITKYVAQAHNILVPAGVLLHRKEDYHPLMYPHVLRSLDEGSSMGVRLVRTPTEAEALHTHWPFSLPLLLEEFIPGIEISTAFLGSDYLGSTYVELEHDEIFSYEKKSQHPFQCRALRDKIPPLKEDQARKITQKLYNIFQCDGLVRCDFRYNPQQRKLYFIEMNTQPGLTPGSIIPQMIRGFETLSALVHRMIQHALHTL